MNFFGVRFGNIGSTLNVKMPLHFAPSPLREGSNFTARTSVTRKSELVPLCRITCYLPLWLFTFSLEIAKITWSWNWRLLTWFAHNLIKDSLIWIILPIDWTSSPLLIIERKGRIGNWNPLFTDFLLSTNSRKKDLRTARWLHFLPCLFPF